MTSSSKKPIDDGSLQNSVVGEKYFYICFFDCLPDGVNTS